MVPKIIQSRLSTLGTFGLPGSTLFVLPVNLSPSRTKEGLTIDLKLPKFPPFPKLCYFLFPINLTNSSTPRHSATSERSVVSGMPSSPRASGHPGDCGLVDFDEDTHFLFF